MGVGAAVGFSALALVIYAITGSAAFKANDVGVGQVLGFYFIGGAIGGATLGLLRPLVRSGATAAIVGFLVTLPLAGVLRVSLYGVGNWTSKHVIGVVVLAALFGPLAGFVEWINRHG